MDARDTERARREAEEAVADEPAPAWVVEPEHQAMHKKVLTGVEVTARRRGVDRRAFLATSAGVLATLGVANRLAKGERQVRAKERNDARRAAQAAGSTCFDAPNVAPPGAGFRAGFTSVDASTQADWMWIGMATISQQPAVAQTILNMLNSLQGFFGGFKVDQFHHARMAASLAKRDNASDEMILSALLHDVGKVISIEGHPEIAAGILRPYVSDAAYQIIRTHQDFQGRHYYAYLGRSATLRDKYRSEPWFGLAEVFTDGWDQTAFDPSFPVPPIGDFEPLIVQFFNNPNPPAPPVCG